MTTSYASPVLAAIDSGKSGNPRSAGAEGVTGWSSSTRSAFVRAA